MAKVVKAPASAGKVIDKHAVAVSFSRAANSYDDVANIQRWVIDALLQEFAEAQQLESMLDIGCGTGHLTLEIAKQIRPQKIIGLDIAEGMVSVANQKLKADSISHQIQCDALCGDAEAIPFADNYFCSVASSFALQWCPDLNQVFSEVFRTLKKGGRFYFALPVGDTLKELKACWKSVDPNNSHVNDFYSLDDLNYFSSSAGFSQRNIRVETVQEHYDDLKAITHALKAMGAHNVTQGRAKQLTGKEKIKQLKANYEHYRETPGLPLTWDVAFGVLEK